MLQHTIRQAPLNLAERPLSAEQLLAAAVFGQALADAVDSSQSIQCRTGATAFLQGNTMLAFWAAVAGLPAELVQRHARRCLKRRARTPLKRVRVLRRDERLEHRRPAIACV